MSQLNENTNLLESLYLQVNTLSNAGSVEDYEALNNRVGVLEGYVVTGYDGNEGLLDRVATLEAAICLREGTQILMADGTTKAIETIAPNEMIASWDIENGTLIPSKVYAAIYTGRARNWRSMIFENGSILDIFGTHQIYCVEQGMPYSTKNWEYDMHSLTPAGVAIAYSFGNQENTMTMMPYKKYTLFCDTGLYFANGVLCGHKIAEPLTAYYLRSKAGFALTEAEVAELTAYALEYDHAHDPYLRNTGYLNDALPYLKTRNTANKNIAQYKKELEKRDYKTIKAAQGALSEEENILNKSECESFRAKIAEEEEIARVAQQEINVLRDRHSAYGNSYPALIKKQLKEAAQKARERYGELAL